MRSVTGLSVPARAVSLAVPVLAFVFLTAGAAASAGPCASSVYLSARLAAAQFDFDRAADLFRGCLKRDGDDLQLLNSSYLFAVAAGRIDDAVPMAKKLTQLVPEGRVPHLTLAVAAVKRRDFAEARKEIAWVSKGNAAPVALALIDMWAAAGAGDDAAVAADLERVKNEGGLPMLAAFSAALVAEYRGDEAAAEAAYLKVLHSFAPTPRVIDAFGRFLERGGKADEAKALYESVQRHNAFRPVALAGMARIAKGEKPDPLIVGPSEGAAEALFGIAVTLNDEEDIDSSMFYLRLALYLRPHFDLADMMLAARFAASGKDETALALFEDVPSSSPFYTLAAIQRIETKARLGDEAGALKDAEALASASPDDVDVFLTLGNFRSRMEDKRGAIKAYGKAIALAKPMAKSDWRLYFARATTEHENGDWRAAETDLKAALALDPEQPLVLNYLGYTWVDRGEHLDEALKLLEKAARLDPENGFVADSVGWAYYRLGQYAKAVDLLERATVLTPQDPTINDHLGDAYWKAGMTLEARYQWNHAIAFGATGKDKAAIDKKIEVGLADGK